MNIEEKETQRIEEILCKKNILQAKLDIESSSLYYKKLHHVCVFNYCKENTDSMLIENYLEIKGSEISDSTNFLMIGWNKNSIYFLRT